MIDKEAMLNTLDEMESTVRAGLKSAIADLGEFREGYETKKLNINIEEYDTGIGRRMQAVNDYAGLRDKLESCKTHLMTIEEYGAKETIRA